MGMTRIEFRLSYGFGRTCSNHVYIGLLVLILIFCFNYNLLSGGLSVFDSGIFWDVIWVRKGGIS